MEKVKVTATQFEIISEYFNRDANERMLLVLTDIELDLVLGAPVDSVIEKVMVCINSIKSYLEPSFAYSILDLFEINENTETI